MKNSQKKKDKIRKNGADTIEEDVLQEQNGKMEGKEKVAEQQDSPAHTDAAEAKAAKKGAETKESKKAADDEVARLKAELDRLRDQYLRKVAEFENYRKRKDKEVADSWTHATAELIKKLLPVLDDLDRSIEYAKKENNTDALLEGIELVKKSFMKVLSDENVEEIEAVGAEFNPEVHEALMQLQKDGAKPNTVVEQHQKGYKLGEKILRPAKVIVSK